MLLLVSFFAACGAPRAAENKSAAQPPAKVENPVKESDLATIKLTPQAEQRLGIVTAPVEFRLVNRTRDYSGEVVTPTDRTIIVSSPMTGTLAAPESGAQLSAGMFVKKGETLLRLTPYLAPERDLRVQLERDVAAATERVNAARLRLERAQQLLNDRAGSVKAVEQAREETNLAENDLQSARRRLEIYDRGPLSSDQNVNITAPISGLIQKVNVAPGQATTGGAAICEITSQSTVWIRVPVYVGELNQIARTQAARIHGLAASPGAPVRMARPVAAPPSANSIASTVDLYYQIANRDGSLRPGQRLGVTLGLRGSEESLVVPWAAVLHDVHAARGFMKTPRRRSLCDARSKCVTWQIQWRCSLAGRQRERRL